MSNKQYYTRHTDLSAEEIQRAVAWRLVVARTWTDKAFKDRLTQSPREALAEYGIQVPAGVNLTILQETENDRYLVLPSKESEVTVMDVLAEPDPGF
jgi:hypothetical protein